MHHAAATSVAAALAQAVITFPDVSGGGTDSVGTVQLNNLDGKPLTSARVVRIVQRTTQYGGTTSGTATFATITGAGTAILEGSGTAEAVVRTTATGSFGITCTNSADETIWISVATQDTQSALSEGIHIVEQIADGAAWSA